VAKDYPKLFDWWVRNQVPKMVKHYGQYMQEARQRKMPYHFVRFEDLVADPRPHYVNIMKYLLQMDSLEGTNAMRRVQEVLDQGHGATRTYTIKDTTCSLIQTESTTMKIKSLSSRNSCEK